MSRAERICQNHSCVIAEFIYAAVAPKYSSKHRPLYTELTINCKCVQHSATNVFSDFLDYFKS